MSTFTILFHTIKSKKKANGTVPLYARITINGQRVELALKRYILPEHWDPKRGAPKSRKGKEKELQAYLETIRNKIYQAHRKLLEENPEDAITAKMLKDQYQGKTSTFQHSIISVYEHHNKQLKELIGNGYSHSTYKRFSTGIKHVREFLHFHYNVEDMPLHKLDYAFVNNFDHYLRSVRNINNNSTVKYVSLLRKTIRMAMKNGWLDKDPFAHYEGRLKTVDREFLTKDELQDLKSQPFRMERLEAVRDIFLFACYTGLAYVDVAKLKEDHITRDVEGEYWIRINRTKTDTKAMIPLLPEAMEIIQKYEESPDRLIKGSLLPVRSNQKMNAYLKEVANICGIKKNLTFHMARHTFATTVTLSNGVPIESVSAMLGHTNIKTTQHYAKILQSKVGEDMKALRRKLASKKSSQEEADNIRKLG